MRPTCITAAAKLLAAAALGLATGCGLLPGGGETGELAVTGRGAERVRLAGDFETAVYSFDDRNTLTVVLVEGPLEAPSQAVTLRMMWRPRAGATPISSAATNATVRYLVFTGDPARGGRSGEAGVYAGGGFLYLRDRPGEARLKASVWEASVHLIDRSPAFRDLLGPATLTGGFTARRDDVTVNRLLHHLSARVTRELGYPRLVGVPAEGSEAASGARPGG